MSAHFLTFDAMTGTNTFDIATGNPPAGSLITANSLSDNAGEGIIIQQNFDTNTIDHRQYFTYEHG